RHLRSLGRPAAEPGRRRLHAAGPAPRVEGAGEPGALRRGPQPRRGAPRVLERDHDPGQPRAAQRLRLGALELPMSRTHPLPLRTALASALLACCALALSVASRAAPADEYAVKAAFLLNFARLVEWPAARQPAAGRPFVVSVAGGADVERALADVLAGK